MVWWRRGKREVIESIEGVVEGSKSKVLES